MKSFDNFITALLITLVIIALVLFSCVSAKAQTNGLPPLASQIGKPTITQNPDGSVDIVTPTAYGPNTNHFVPSTSTTAGADILSGFQKIISSTNMLWEAHATYAAGLSRKWGGGIGGFYLVNDYVYAGIRIDWVDGGFWMPQGNVGLQLPFKLTSWFTLTPFTYGGIGVPLSGAQFSGLTVPGTARDNNGQATAIIGVGAAVKLFDFSKHLDVGLLGDGENWSGFSGHQYRVGSWFRVKV